MPHNGLVFTAYKPVKFIRKFAKQHGIPCFFKTNKVSNRPIFNFGATDPCVKGEFYYNSPEGVKAAVHKLRTFELLKSKGLPTLEYTTFMEQAHEWLGEDSCVFGRTKEAQHSGNGIVFMQPGDDITVCKFYTKAILKGREFRVHVSQDYPLHSLVQQKRRENGFTGDNVVKTRANGWVFCINSPWLDQHTDVHYDLVQVALDALLALGLDYGAVDIIVKGGKLYVVEVNTAPALKAVSVQAYYDKLFTLYNEGVQ